MAMTTLPDQLESRTTTEAPASEPPTSRQGLFGWLVAGAAIVASTVLVALVLVGGDDPAEPRPWYSVEHGSIAAIDHAAEAAAVAAQPSIAAADHAAGAEPRTAADLSAEHGSIAAIDHAAATPSAARSWYSDHGSVTALDHEADETGAG